MKTFRLWLLVLLAVLLPVRGALAAAMLCPAGGVGNQVEAQQARHAHSHHAHSHDGAGTMGHENHHEALAQAHGSGHEGAAGGTQDPAGTGADRCNLCSAFCSVTGVVGAHITVAQSQPGPTVFPQLYAPPPSFFSDGQERPPRTI